MAERRLSSRQKSYLQGRIYFNNRRTSVDCLVRDLSEAGARIRLSEAVVTPEVMELYILNREEVRRARVEWRHSNEMGVAFIEAAQAAGASDAEHNDLLDRLRRLEVELAALKRVVNGLRSEGRQQPGSAA